MSENKLPARIQGEWIWKNSLLKRPESFLLMRKEFICTSVELETDFWITANCMYQLFINGRFVGFGPRAHQNCGTSYVDLHQVTYCLETGINVIAVLVYHNSDREEGNWQEPGLWCQMEANGKVLLCSDHSWIVRDGDCFTAPRPRISRNRGRCQYLNAADAPLNWITPVFLPDSDWMHPDCLTPVGNFGTRLELHPLSPSEVEVENPNPLPLVRGKISGIPDWTQVLFKNPGGGWETYAAHTFLFSEEETTLPVRIFSDDPLKLFCNNRRLLAADFAMGIEVELPLRAGWNRLLLVQTPRYNSMGFVLLPLAGERAQSEYWFCREPDRDASKGWRIVGPLKLSLREATSSLKFERLDSAPYLPNLAELTDPGAVLGAVRFEPETLPADEQEAVLAWSRPLAPCEYAVYRLDVIRYGFIRITLDATEGDLVDITVGSRLAESGFVSAGKGIRGTGTLRCRNAKNVYITLIPNDCFYVMVSVRSAVGAVKILSIGFEELTRNEQDETVFHCSDELLNEFWEVGKQTLRRSAAFVPLEETRGDDDCYLLDAYIDAVNMAAVFGDHEYAAARLQQFLDAQLENGDIPALSYGTKHTSQFHQLFFLPVWIYYNYRYSANISQLKKTIPGLDLTREFFEAMLDEKTGLLIDAAAHFGFGSQLSSADFREGEKPTYLNSLFCRFLLSSSEIYQTIEDNEKAEHCMALAEKVAAALRERNFDPACGLFCRWSRECERIPDHNLFANFCAMYGGVLPLSAFEYFFYSFFNYDPPFDRSGESRHPYFHFLFMEMMFALGRKEWPFRYFRDYWAKRICPDAVAWRVDFDHDDPAPTKFAEGSCVSPNLFLLREVLGIRIAEAGHSVVYFNPAFKLVDSAEGVVPTVHGRIKVRWKVQEDGVLDVTLDASVPVKILPEMSHKQLANTVFRLGEHVTLLNPTPEYDADEKAEEEENKAAGK